MSRWKAPGLKNAWERWEAYLEDVWQERAQEAQELAKQQLEAAARATQRMAEAEAERRIAMCKRVVQRMLRHQLLMAWIMFVDTLREMQHNRETVRKVLLRMQYRQLAGAFDCYAGAVDKLVAQREKVATTMSRWKAPGLKKAWDRWEAYLEDVWQERAQEAQELATQQLEEAARATQRMAEAEAERRIAMCKLGQRDSAIDRMRRMVSKLQETLSQDVLNIPHEQDATGLHNRTTLGILLNCCIIDRLVLGGPAWKSKFFKIGDEIDKVDGIRADRANIHELLIGNDVPGSSVSITLKTDGWHGLGKTVELKRMSAIAIADRVRMFELFSSMKARAKDDKDTKAAALVDLAIDLWTAMLSAEAEHELKVASKVLKMQESCEAIVDDMDKLLSCSLTGADSGDETSTSAYTDRNWQQTAAHALGDVQEGTTVNLAQRLKKESCHESERNVIRQLLEQAAVTLDERHQARRSCDNVCTPSTSTRQSGGNHNDRRLSGGSDKDSPRREQTNSSETSRKPKTQDAAQRERPRSYSNLAQQGSPVVSKVTTNSPVETVAKGLEVVTRSLFS
jgi:hypothetical protein